MRHAACDAIRFDFPNIAANISRVSKSNHNSFSAKIIRPFVDLFGLSRSVAAAAVFVIAAIVVVAVWYFIHLAPPKLITISAGPQGSFYWNFATNYQARLASNHITLVIQTSAGSQENLQRISDHAVDIGFVQSGITNKVPSDVVSLGSISYQPLLVFYRSETNLSFLSQFKGRRLAVGAAGSGTRILATGLLATNGVTAANTTFVNIEAAAAAKALLSTNVDAVFLTSDSAPLQVLTNLIRRPEIKLFNFVQADAYTRRITYLNKTVFPMGSLDFGANLPREDINLVAPTVELLARKDLHPATIDLLIETARDVHGRATLLQKQKEFPKLVQLDVPLSVEAERFYNSGKTGTYKHLPFWLANIVNRILLVFIPAIVVLIPTLRLIPILLAWKTKLKLYRWYRALIAVERETLSPIAPKHPEALLKRLDEIEEYVSKMKVPVSFADQYYGLRGHISFVRSRLADPNQM